MSKFKGTGKVVVVLGNVLAGTPTSSPKTIFNQIKLMNRTSIFWTGIIGVSLFVIAAILGGFQFDDYSHISQYISESYVIGTPYGKELSFLGYIPSGILITIFAFSAARKFSTFNLIRIGFYGIGIFYGIATILVGIFPCDTGCNKEWIDPSLSQAFTI